MTTDTIIAAGIVVFLGLAGWLRAFFLHRSCNPNASYAIKAPAIICYLFGSIRKDHIVNFAGFLGQVAIYSIVPLLVLYLFGKVTPYYVKIGFGLTLAILFLLEFLYLTGILRYRR